MPLACIYDKEGKYRVVPIEQREQLVASGEWFSHPKGYLNKEIKHEKQIRQQPRKRRSNGENSPQSIGS
jgi:hypothetical protein